ncbi:unnamed protein product [Urochloa humidicola]
MTMKRGGQGSSAGAAATMVILLVALMLVVVAASMPAEAVAVPRRLGESGTNHCSNDPNNHDQGCHVPPATEAQAGRLISVSKQASAGHSNCTYDPSAPPGNCPAPPARATTP